MYGHLKRFFFLIVFTLAIFQSSTARVVMTGSDTTNAFGFENN